MAKLKSLASLKKMKITVERVNVGKSHQVNTPTRWWLRAGDTLVCGYALCAYAVTRNGEGWRIDFYRANLAGVLVWRWAHQYRTTALRALRMVHP